MVLGGEGTVGVLWEGARLQSERRTVEVDGVVEEGVEG